MNWIIDSSEKMPYHTHLNEITKPFQSEIENYDWFLSDLVFFPGKHNLPINHDKEFFILSANDFKTLISADIQIIWGVILAIPKDVSIQLNEQELPFADGNEKIWEPGNFQHPNAEIEIDCFDSSYTIVKFKSKTISIAFKNYFEEAIELEKFK